VSGAPYAVELKALRKSFGKTEIIRGTDLAASARRAARSCSTASGSTA